MASVFSSARIIERDVDNLSLARSYSVSWNRRSFILKKSRLVAPGSDLNPQSFSAQYYQWALLDRISPSWCKDLERKEDCRHVLCIRLLLIFQYFWSGDWCDSTLLLVYRISGQRATLTRQYGERIAHVTSSHTITKTETILLWNVSLIPMVLRSFAATWREEWSTLEVPMFLDVSQRSKLSTNDALSKTSWRVLRKLLDYYTGSKSSKGRSMRKLIGIWRKRGTGTAKQKHEIRRREWKEAG